MQPDVFVCRCFIGYLVRTGPLPASLGVQDGGPLTLQEVYVYTLDDL